MRSYATTGRSWMGLLIGFAAVAGCGGTSDGPPPQSDASSDSAAASPRAVAGPDQSVEVGTLATLDGRASEGPSLQFEWTLVSKPSGSSAELSAPRERVVRFLVDRPGTYVARLVVRSGEVASAPSLVAIKGFIGTSDA